jgi:hypothetical protein
MEGLNTLDVSCRKDSGSRSGREEKRDTDARIGCRNDGGKFANLFVGVKTLAEDTVFAGLTFLRG